ncbi:hypothetical protein ACOZ4Y_03565 [Komagataeibacter rhaeticus]|uniref:hypothetical protein n=1 Tax=Komagataeibacter rhaeticus TaxID=215221 RepID=UPI0011B3F2C9|nr:hypothetical protein [Komagataeibacter rhaeticus]MBL7239143.1 hypothetical protein [Komagataeibacter rhaeticus]
MTILEAVELISSGRGRKMLREYSFSNVNTVYCLFPAGIVLLCHAEKQACAKHIAQGLYGVFMKYLRGIACQYKGDTRTVHARAAFKMPWKWFLSC